MFKLFTKLHVFASLYNKQAQATRIDLRGIRMMVLLVIFFILAIASSNNLYADDRDGDSLADEEEYYIASHFQPIIWAGPAEGCGPLWYSNYWCLDDRAGAYHQRGYLGYDVVDLKFSDLFAIEYTLFYDYNCGLLDIHWFDNEGFTVLVQKCSTCPDSFRLVSIQTCGHHNSWEDVWDRLYPHEVDGLGQLGLMASEDYHATYVHHHICEGHLMGSVESCAPQGDHEAIPLNNLSEFGMVSYQGNCPCDPESLECLDDSLANPDCWSERYFYHSGRYSNCEHPDEQKSLYEQRKQFPPWVPIEIELPENLAYADLFEESGFTAEPEHRDADDSINFGPGLFNSGMPLRIINVPHGSWWRQLYDLEYYLADPDLADKWWGLRREVFQYRYWTKDGAVRFIDNVESIKLHGLPGTMLTLYDTKEVDGERIVYNAFFMVVTNGMRDTTIEDLQVIGFDNNIDFVSWGFGPTADAGNDTTIACGGEVWLDARGSYKYALSLQTLAETFRIDTSIFRYDKSWSYWWEDESYPGAKGNVFLGFGPQLPVRGLPPGQHRIKLTVGGRVYPYPDSIQIYWQGQVSDWRNVVVEPPEQFGIIRPNGGEIFSGGCLALILWKPACSFLAKIEFSTDAGATWSTVADSLSNQGAYFWSIPNGISSSNCLLKVSQLGTILSDVTDKVFTIRPKVPPMVYPVNHSVGASNSTPINILFGSSMDESTINDSSLFVYSDLTGYAKLNITYDSQTTTATLVPSSGFSPGAHVSVLMESPLKYSDRSRFCGPVTTSFTVGVKKATEFIQASTYRVGKSPMGAAPGDFDKDGDIDVAVTNNSSNSVSILLNDGTGKFDSVSSYSVPAPYRIIAADIDQDFDLDLITCHQQNEGLSLLRNDGMGHFVVEHIGLYPGYGYAYSVVAGDLNWFLGTGYLDLAAAEWGYNGVSIVTNWGNQGGLKYMGIIFAGTGPQDITLGDFDNDGDNDLATANRYYGDVSILINDGTGMAFFKLEGTYEVADAPNTIASADFDGDGDLDIATGHSSVTSDQLSILYNNGDGTFAPATYYTVGVSPSSVIAVDVNGDSSIDLVCGNEMDDDISILLNDGHGKFAAQKRYQVGDSPGFIVAADFEGDGDLDILTVNRLSNNVSVLFNAQAPHILLHTPEQNDLNAPKSTDISVTFDTRIDPSSINDTTFIAHGSYTGLHRGVINYDILTNTASLNPSRDFSAGEVVSVILTSGIQSIDGIHPAQGLAWSFTVATDGGSGNFSLDSVYQQVGFPRSGVIADLNNDGFLDVATACMDSNSVICFFNNGDGTLSPDSVYPVESNPNSIVAADLDNDGDLDLAVAQFKGISVLLNKGSGFFVPDSTYSVGWFPRSLCATDIDNDGNLDLVAATGNNIISVLRNRGDGTFLPSQDSHPFSGWFYSRVCATDIEGDGYVDILATDLFNNSLVVLSNNRYGYLYEDSAYATGDGPVCVVSRDFNGDHKLDIAVANSNSCDISILLNNGHGIFLADSQYSVGSNPSNPLELFAGDIDGDGDIDLVGVTSYAEGTFVLTNNGAGKFQLRWTGQDAGYAQRIFSGDLDNDGDLDIVTLGGSVYFSTLLNSAGTAVGEEEHPAMPKTFVVSQNYPNPFNPITQIDYALPKDCNVKIDIFNILGQKVKTLIDEFQTAGLKIVHWDGKDDNGQACASGIYFYKIQAGEFSQAKKMVIVK
jgi:hypothetical protein